jgi:hypothetical protein
MANQSPFPPSTIDSSTEPDDPAVRTAFDFFLVYDFIYLVAVVPQNYCQILNVRIVVLFAFSGYFSVILIFFCNFNYLTQRMMCFGGGGGRIPQAVSLD